MIIYERHMIIFGTPYMILTCVRQEDQETKKPENKQAVLTEYHVTGEPQTKRQRARIPQEKEPRTIVGGKRANAPPARIATLLTKPKIIFTTRLKQL